MQLAKSITPKKINKLSLRSCIATILLTAIISPAFSQDNSPYTRYGLGDLVPGTNILSRGMGGITAGIRDPFSVNFNNPASYTSFVVMSEPKSNKISNGRAVLDVGINFESRSLTEPGTLKPKFVANNALFSHIQIGLPLSKRFGLTFGLRPITRISYKIFKQERIMDPLTGLPIDSAYTQYQGDGGTNLASAGLGYKLIAKEKTNLSIGVNGGYMFGRKDYTTRISFINDTIEYYQGNFQNRTTFGSFFFNAGIQYMQEIKPGLTLTIGAAGNLEQTLKARQDIIRETYYVDASLGNTRIDSVYEKNDIRGDIIYPSMFTIGFAIERKDPKKTNWLIGVDFNQANWENYRFYGQKDSVRNKWELRVGGQLRPVNKNTMFSNMAYRAGFFIGPDYIQVGQKLPQFGASFGLGIPIRYQRQAPGQVTMIDLSFEYIKRGNNNNLLRENLFRVSFGMGLSDIWFIKRKYE